MSEKEKMRRIAVSETTFSQMSEELIEHLKTEEKVLLFVVEDSLIHEHKMLMHEKIDGIILSKEEEKEIAIELAAPEMFDDAKLEKQLEEMSKVFEMQDSDLPEIIDHEALYNKPKQKFYVPRIIGRSNSKKKGGR